jgi:hypothetical protein
LCHARRWRESSEAHYALHGPRSIRQRVGLPVTLDRSRVVRVEELREPNLAISVLRGSLLRSIDSRQPHDLVERDLDILGVRRMLGLTPPVEEFDQELGRGQRIAVALGQRGQASRRLGDEVSFPHVPGAIEDALPKRIGQEIVFGFLCQLGQGEQCIRGLVGIVAEGRGEELFGDVGQLRIAGSRGEPASRLVWPCGRQRARECFPAQLQRIVQTRAARLAHGRGASLRQ